MQDILHRTRGLTLLLSINWDRILFIAVVLFALGAGAWVGQSWNQ